MESTFAWKTFVLGLVVGAAIVALTFTIYRPASGNLQNFEPEARSVVEDCQLTTLERTQLGDCIAEGIMKIIAPGR